MNEATSPPRGGTREYVLRTLCSMEKDKKCEWDRLCRLVLSYYRENIKLGIAER